MGNKNEYPHKKYCKKLEKAGLYVRKEDEPTNLGYFLESTSYICHMIRVVINKLSEGA